MLKKTTVVAIVFLFVGLALAPGINANVNRLTEKGLIGMNGGNHPPIYIDGNDDFTPENGVTGGNGTEENPYIIEDWVIIGDGSTDDGIFINNTDVYFVIRNCSISNFTGMYESGIRFHNVKNGFIIDTKCYRNDDGIRIVSSAHINLQNCSGYNNSFHWWSSGIDCYLSSNVTITSCEFYDNEYGIELTKTSYIVIEKSMSYNNGRFGIDINGVQPLYITIKDCKVYNNPGGGILLSSDDDRTHPSYAHILNCEIYDNGIMPGIDNGFPGLGISGLHWNIVENCTIYHNGLGIGIINSRNNIIRNCSIYNHRRDTGIFAPGIIIQGFLGGLNMAGNSSITNCDIYNNEIGIALYIARKTTVQKNNVFNNSHCGINVAFLSTPRIHHNNIYSNGFEEGGWGGVNVLYFSLLDARNNWWGSDDGPKVYRLDRKANVHPNHGGHGDSIYRFWSVLFFRPWATELIPDAGRQ